MGNNYDYNSNIDEFANTIPVFTPLQQPSLLQKKQEKVNRLQQKATELVNTQSSSEPDADSNKFFRIQGGDSAEVAHNIVPTGNARNERKKVYAQVAYMNNIPLEEAVKQVDSEYAAVQTDPNLPGMITHFRETGDIPKDFKMTSWDIYDAGNKDYQYALKDKEIYPETAFDNYEPFDTHKKGWWGRNLVDNKDYVLRQIAAGHMTPGANDPVTYQQQLESAKIARDNHYGDYATESGRKAMDAILNTSYNKRITDTYVKHQKAVDEAMVALGLNTGEGDHRTMTDKAEDFLRHIADSYVSNGWVEPLAFVGKEANKYVLPDSMQMNLGTTEDRTKIINNITGVSNEYTRRHEEAIQKIIHSANHKISEKDKGIFDRAVEYFSGDDGAITAMNRIYSNLGTKDLMNITKEAFANTDTTGDTIGFVLAMGGGSGILKAIKGADAVRAAGFINNIAHDGITIGDTIKALRETKLPRKVKGKLILDTIEEAKKNATKLQKTVNILNNNSNLVKVTLGQMNASDEEYKRNTGHDKSATKKFTDFFWKLGGNLAYKIASIKTIQGTASKAIGSTVGKIVGEEALEKSKKALTGALTNIIKFGPPSASKELLKQVSKAGLELTANAALQIPAVGAQSFANAMTTVDLDTQEGRDILKNKVEEISASALGSIGMSAHFAALHKGPGVLKKSVVPAWKIATYPMRKIIDIVGARFGNKENSEADNVTKSLDEVKTGINTEIDKIPTEEPLVNDASEYQGFELNKQYNEEDVKGTIEHILLHPEQYPDTSEKQAFMFKHKDIVQKIADTFNTKIDENQQGEQQVEENKLKVTKAINANNALTEAVRALYNKDIKLEKHHEVILNNAGITPEDINTIRVTEVDSSNMQRNAVNEKVKSILDAYNTPLEMYSNMENLGVNEDKKVGMQKKATELHEAIDKNENISDNDKQVLKDGINGVLGSMIFGAGKPNEQEKDIAESMSTSLPEDDISNLKFAIADETDESALASDVDKEHDRISILLDEVTKGTRNNSPITNSEAKYLKPKRAMILTDDNLFNVVEKGDTSSLETSLKNKKDSKLLVNNIAKLNILNISKTHRDVFKKVTQAIAKHLTDSKSTKNGFLANTEENKRKTAALRMVAIAVNQIHSSTVSSIHEALNENATDIPDGTAAFKIYKQIGKELIHSYGLKLKGPDVNVAYQETKLGKEAVKLAISLGLVKSEKGPVYNVNNIINRDNERIEAKDLGLEAKVDINGEGVGKDAYYGDILKLVDSEHKDGTMATALHSDTANTFKLLKPLLNISNIALPEHEISKEPVRSDKGIISPEMEAAVKNLQDKPFKMKQHILDFLNGYKALYDTSVKAGKPITKFLKEHPTLTKMLQLKNVPNSFLKDSVNGSNWARIQAFQDVMDNLDHFQDNNGKAKDLYFNYKVDVNERTSLLNTILNFQGDNVFARHVLTIGGKNNHEGKWTPETAEDYAELVNNIADEFKGLASKQEERMAIILKEGLDTTFDEMLKEYSDNTSNLAHIYNDSKYNKYTSGFDSGFKLDSLLKAISDVRQAEKKGNSFKDIKTDYMVGADASASGVMNTLINIVGTLDPTNPEEKILRDKTMQLLRSYGVKFSSDGKEIVSEPSDPYTSTIVGALEGKKALEGILAKIEAAGIDRRELAKPPVMVGFYGKNTEAIQKQTVTDIAMKLYKSALGIKDKGIKISATNRKNAGAYIKELINKDISIHKMTKEDFKLLEKAIEKTTLAEVITKSFNDTFNIVNEYRNLMNGSSNTQGSVFSLLSKVFGKVWKGEFPGAVDVLLDAKEPTNMSVFKKKNVLLNTRPEDLSKSFTPLFGYKPMMNATSMGVNPQHSEDSALNLTSAYRAKIKNAIMTVHDAHYGTAMDIRKTKKEYNKAYLELPNKYSYYESALKLVKDLKAKYKDLGDYEAATNSIINMLETKIKHLNTFRKEHLDTNTATADIFGLKAAKFRTLEEARKVTKLNRTEEEIALGEKEQQNIKDMARKDLFNRDSKDKDQTNDNRSIYEQITGNKAEKGANHEAKGTYYIVDTETAGLDGDVYNIAIGKFVDGKFVSHKVIWTNKNSIMKDAKVKSDAWFHAPGKFSDEAQGEMKKYIENHTNDFISPEEAVKELHEFIDKDAFVIAKNARYDRGKLNKLVNKGSNEEAVHNKFKNYEDDALDIIINKDTSGLYKTDNKHTALTDVINTNRAILDRLHIPYEKGKDAPIEENTKSDNGVSKVVGSKTVEVLIKNIKGMLDNLGDSNEIKTLKEMLESVSKNVTLGTRIERGKDFSIDVNNMLLTIPEDLRDVLVDSKGNLKDLTEKRLTELLMHELEHDKTAAYIVSEFEKDGSNRSYEIKYLKRVIEKLEKNSKNITDDEIKQRVGYILKQNDDAYKVAELVAVLRAEPKFADGISKVIYKENKKSFTQTLLKKIAAVIKNVLNFDNKNIALGNTIDAINMLENNALKFKKNNNITIKNGEFNAGNKNKLRNKSLLKMVDDASLGILGRGSELAKRVLLPFATKMHLKTYSKKGLYYGAVNLVKNGVWDSDLMRQLKVSMHTDGITDRVTLDKMVTIATNISQQTNDILSTNIPAHKKALKKIFKDNKELKVLTSTFKNTGLIHVLLAPKLEQRLLSDEKLEDIKSSFNLSKEQLGDAEEIANKYVFGIVGRKRLLNTENLVFNNVTELNKFNQYVALLAMSKIEGSRDSLKKFAKENRILYEDTKADLLAVKATSDRVNGLTGTTAKFKYTDYDGNYLLDITESPYEFALVPKNLHNNIKYSNTEGWQRIPNGKGDALFIRKIDTKFSAKGVGLSTDRHVNNYTLNSKYVEEALKKDSQYLIKNNIAVSLNNGIRKYSLVIKTANKEKYMDLADDLSESLYRTLAYNKELIETETVRDIAREKAIKHIGPKELNGLLRDVKQLKKKKKLNHELPMFLKIDEKAFVGEVNLPKELGEYYKIPSNKLAKYNNFNKEITFIRKDMEHVLLDSKSTAIFKQGTTARKIETIHRHIVSMFKLHLISNPAKLLGDAVANSVLLSDVPMDILTKYGKTYATDLDKLGKLTTAKIKAELKAYSDPKYEKIVKNLDKQIKASPLYPALKHGFLQSLSTGFFLKDFESISGLQTDIEKGIKKLLEKDNGNKTKIFKIIDKMSKLGFQGEDVFRFLSKITGKNKNIISSELSNIANRLEENKNDGELVRYVAEFIGAPSSELVRQSSNIMTNIDGYSKFVYYKYLIANGVEENKAAQQSNDRFLDYRINMPEPIKLLGDVGILLFPGFWMKYQRTLGVLLKENPVTSLTGYTIDDMLGVGHAHPFGANIFRKFSEGTIISGVNPLDEKVWNPLWWIF